MMGYATTPADLAAGHTVDALRTGDLARRRPDGLWEVVGRTSRIAKVCGLRVDLDRVERTLARRGTVAAVADAGDRIVVGVVEAARPVDADVVRREAADAAGLAPTGVEVVVLADLPRLPHGKVDHRALAALRAAPAPAPASATVDRRRRHRAAGPAARTPGRPPRRLLRGPRRRLPVLRRGVAAPRAPARAPARRLAHPARRGAAPPPSPAAGSGRRRRGVAVETGVALRALAIVTIVGSHANLFTLLGGAHVLLAIVGFNLGRFQLGERTRTERTRAILRGLGRVVVPSVLVIGTVAAFSRDITWKQAALLTAFTEWSWSEPRWSYWFIEAMVLAVLVLAALLAVPAIDRASRRHPFGTPVVLLLVLLPTRYDLVGLPGDHVHRAHGVLWLLLLGWAMSQASTRAHRLVVSALVLALVPGFFSVGGLERDVYLAAGLLALTWVPHVRVPAALASVVGALASSSLWIYLLHWRVYPWFEVQWPLLATLLSLLVGVLAASVVRRVGNLGRRGGVVTLRRPAVERPQPSRDRAPLTRGRLRGPGRHDQPAHLAARPAGHGRRGRHERLRHRAVPPPRGPRDRGRRLHPRHVLLAAPGRRGARHRWRGAGAPRRRRTVRGAHQGRAARPAVHLRPRGAAHRGGPPAGSLRRRALALLALRPGRGAGPRPVAGAPRALHAHDGQGQERRARARRHPGAGGPGHRRGAGRAGRGPAGRQHRPRGQAAHRTCTTPTPRASRSSTPASTSTSSARWTARRRAGRSACRSTRRC